MTFRHKIQGLTTMVAMTALAIPSVAMAAPPPQSSWNLETTFTPGGAVTAAMPWQSLHASGSNCDTNLVPLSVGWARDGIKLQGRNAPTIDSTGGSANPVVFKNTSGTPSNGWANLGFAVNQVGITVSASRCGVIRFVAPVDGVYQVSGEFFSPKNLIPNANPATNKVTAFVRSGTQQSSGLVDKPGGIQSWSIPGGPTYPLQAGQFIDFAVKDAGNGIANDVALLSARVTWMDNLPPSFKASNFDFEGNHGCAIEQGTSKLYCWGRATSSGLILGNNSLANQHKAVPATALHAFLPSGEAIQNIQVGATNNCVRTTPANRTICFGENARYESGNLLPNSQMVDVTSQLGTYTGARLDTASGCIIVAGGQVKCWGANSGLFYFQNKGVLGNKNGNWNDSATPLSLSPILQTHVSQASDVAPGGVFSCAVVGIAKKVVCWGNSSSGHDQQGVWGNGYGGPTLSDPDLYAAYVKTAPGVDLTGVKRVQVNGERACALKNTNQLVCWGGNYTYGNLYGAPNSPAPNSATYATLIGFPSGVSDFAVSDNGICVIVGASGTVLCQGRNEHGEMGITPIGANRYSTRTASYAGTHVVGGNNHYVSYNPVAVMTGAVKIRGGARNVCALTNTNEIKCWGDNEFGQLGSGAPIGAGQFSATPVTVIK